MLAFPGQASHHSHDEVATIHNYYEKRVLEAIYDISERARGGDRNFIADVACVALNRLPPRYIRYDVDMTFFMSPQELNEIVDKVAAAVAEAIAYVSGREKDKIHRAAQPPAKKDRSKTKSRKKSH